LASLCWLFTFGVGWGNFWLKIAFSVLAVCGYALLWRRPAVRWSLVSVAGGMVSAAVLYGLFLAGSAAASIVIPAAASQVHSIYALGEGTDRLPIFLLLFFITGPGEEIFWRGFLQEAMMKRWGALPGFGAAAAVYAGVHIFSLNLMLILAALTAGAFWGALYAWRRDLLLVMVSHSLWSAVIFAVAPVT